MNSIAFKKSTSTASARLSMQRWSQGRVALVGDAAFCISLLGGQGAALAMTAAYVLAGELARSEGRHDSAFRNYEELAATLYRRANRKAPSASPAFLHREPDWVCWLRKQVIRAFRIPGLARYAIGQDIVDTLKLPNYRFARANPR